MPGRRHGARSYSGAATGSAAAAEGAHTLFKLIVLTLSDSAIAPLLGTGDSGLPAAILPSSTASDALASLASLAVKARSTTLEQAGRSETSLGTQATHPRPEVDVQSRGGAQDFHGKGLGSRKRDAAWLTASAERIGGLLEVILPHLQSHPGPAARAAASLGMVHSEPITEMITCK